MDDIELNYYCESLGVDFQRSVFDCNDHFGKDYRFDYYCNYYTGELGKLVAKLPYYWKSLKLHISLKFIFFVKSNDQFMFN